MQFARAALQRLRHFHTASRTMSPFPRFSPEFSPLLRLLDDYDRSFQTTGNKLRAFQPKFDVKENKDSYELHGELPGIEQKDINVEWTDQNTLTVHGRIESHYESRTPSGTVQELEQADKHEYHKPTVEPETEAATSANTNTSVTKPNQNKDVDKAENVNPSRYWVTERSVGEFSRTFNFPGHIDQDKVKASLKNGILSIIVPKIQKPQSRRINIE